MTVCTHTYTFQRYSFLPREKYYCKKCKGTNSAYLKNDRLKVACNENQGGYVQGKIAYVSYWSPTVAMAIDVHLQHNSFSLQCISVSATPHSVNVSPWKNMSPPFWVHENNPISCLYLFLLSFCVLFPFACRVLPSLWFCPFSYQLISDLWCYPLFTLFNVS